MRSDADKVVAALGVTPASDLLVCLSPAELPWDVAVVIVPWSDADGKALAAQVRAARPGARLFAYLVPEQIGAVEAVLAAGYDDLAIGAAHLEMRLEACRPEITLVEAYAARIEAHEGLMSLVTEVAATPDLQEVLRASIIRMSQLFSMERVSVVMFNPGDEYGFIVARSGDQLENLVIRLSDYPELLEISRTREPLLIADVFGDALLSGVRQKLEEAQVPHRSAVLFPLVRREQVVGALFLRSRAQIKNVEDRLLVTGRLIAAVTALAIANALETDMLLRKQRALLRDKADVDQLLADLKPFSEFFEQAHDGIVVTDRNGKISFVNASAAAILRRSADDLKNKNFLDLLGAQYRGLAGKAFRGQEVGDSYGYVDLLVPAEGDEVVVSAAIRVLTQPESVLINFRDVTELRAIEAELRQTKEFLENLIQSSVDAIIASDTEGRIILFNRAAEQILGYNAREVVGRLAVQEIYPSGEAEDVMRRLRSDAYGGKGRLELMKKELVAKSGERVPVNLTAAIIYEGEREVASVGIFTDLRERMKIEEKLNAVQQQLQMSERQAIAIELAGAAAHELNQPLTSILGYAELVKRRIPEGDVNKKPIEVICRETERMAGIVRRIGHITQYKSKQYVGRSTILDLETGEADRGIPPPYEARRRDEPDPEVGK
jgi:PAS domain S-box-containing protein